MLAAVLDSFLREFRTRPMAGLTVAIIAFAGAVELFNYLRGNVPAPLWIVLIVALTIVCVYYAVRLIKAVKSRLLWHLRRRLVITYLFIAVVPVVLILVLVGLAAMMINGQFAAFLVAARIHNQVEELQQVNRVMTHEAHMNEAKTADELLEGCRQFYVRELSKHSASYPDLEIALHLGSESRAFDLNGAPVTEAPGIPDWFRQKEEFAGLVAENGKVFLRAADVGETSMGKITMILSEPLSPELLDIVGAEIGPVGVVIHSEREALPIPPVAPIVPKPKSAQTFEGGTTLLSRSIALPPRANFLDTDVLGTSAMTPVHWSGETEEPLSQPVFIFVTTRLSTLMYQLLATLGRYSHIYVALFLAIATAFFIIELVSLIVGVRLTQSITRTVDKIYDATEHVRTGDFSYRINMPARDQLTSLGEAFDGMTRSIERLMSESREKMLLEHEIQIAHQVQEQLFPRSAPKVPGLQLHGVCLPARGVSGDYYDFLPMEKNRVGIVLGDVSGKGISAALIMAGVQSVFRTRVYEATFASGQFDPARFFGQLNQQMYKSTPEARYATCFYALYDAAARKFVYTNAGHPAPILVRKNETLRLGVGGTPLGLISPASYNEAQVALEAEDILVAFTDGITEAENAYGEEFGEDRLVDVVRRAQGASLQDLVKQIFENVDHWTDHKELQDDRTLIAARAVG